MHVGNTGVWAAAVSFLSVLEVVTAMIAWTHMAILEKHLEIRAKMCS